MTVEDPKLSSVTPAPAVTNIQHGVRSPPLKLHGDSRDTPSVFFLIPCFKTSVLL